MKENISVAPVDTAQLEATRTILEKRIQFATMRGLWLEAEQASLDLIFVVEKIYGVPSPEMAAVYLELAKILEAREKDATIFRTLAKLVSKNNPD